MRTLGTDIIEVIRIATSIERYGDSFLKKIFTPREIEICRERATSAQSFAGKFAAKEAVIKALLSAFPEMNILFSQIEIDNDPNGRPIVRLLSKSKENSRIKSIEVSVSHIKKYANAIAMVEV